jgi:membrane-associated protein
MFGVDVRALIEGAGYVGITAIVFAESGVLLGFFLPGDSLLFTAGFLCGRGVLNIAVLVPLCFVAAVAGDSVGYGIGRRYGRRLFSRPRSKRLKPDHLARAERFFEDQGGRAVVLARFLPWVRTLTPVAAGLGSMAYRRFLAMNLIGAALWAVGLPLAGYFLGATVPSADRYILPAVLVIIVVSAVASSRQVIRGARRQEERAVRVSDADE